MFASEIGADTAGTAGAGNEVHGRVGVAVIVGVAVGKFGVTISVVLTV
ncbi:MAG: hypothetical protein GYA58_00775 [Anaerolineaceae bacterium]|jgi:hypothetical protein|nr:hypothetical protein [Anaerolineaceae bacterium]